MAKLSEYEKLIEKARRKRKTLTRQQQQEIKRMYRRVAESWKTAIERQGKKMTMTWLTTHAQNLEGAIDDIGTKLEELVKAGILTVADAVIDAEATYWTDVVKLTVNKDAAEALRTVYAQYPQKVVEELVKGNIYKGNAGLSSKIWKYSKKQKDDISRIIQDGIMEYRSAYDIAKDLERYVLPTARKPWDWSKVYPFSTKKVDYNAQRLSRTSITHAYQMALVHATEKNPFVGEYQWHASNSSRVCEICLERDGKMFKKDELPLDHPNGMCTVTCVITKSYDEIAKELRDWANGDENEALDDWIFGE